MSVNILSALRQLDVNNDNHWTADGAPRLETVRMLAKDPAVSREALTQVAPGFSRAKGLPDVPAGIPAQPAVAPVAAPIAAVQAPAAETAPEPAPEPATDPVPEPEREVVRCEITSKERALLELARAKAELAHAQSNAARAQEAVDAIIAAEQKAVTKQDFCLTVRGYLDSQESIRQHRAAQMAAMRGIDLKAILPTRAKIDQAFSRRTERGTQRPKFG